MARITFDKCHVVAHASKAVDPPMRRTARAWRYREQLREILDRKKINVVSEMLEQWCTNVMHSKVDPMKDVTRMICSHFDGIVAWTQPRQTNGFLEAINGLFQTAKLDFSKINPHPPVTYSFFNENQKERAAIGDGYRELKKSWCELPLNLKKRAACRLVRCSRAATRQ